MNYYCVILLVLVLFVMALIKEKDLEEALKLIMVIIMILPLIGRCLGWW
jgi:hypothetical protein